MNVRGGSIILRALREYLRITHTKVFIPGSTNEGVFRGI